MSKTKSEKLKLPWKVWDLHVLDCDGNGIAWNVGYEIAKFIVEQVNKGYREDV